MGQVYLCWWRICREIHFLSKFEYHMFYVLYQFATYLLTPLVQTIIGLLNISWWKSPILYFSKT
jgi:hypothetical protein